MDPADPPPEPGASHDARRRWMAILARAGADELTARLAAIPDLPPWRLLRGPESGLIMVRGRVGGGGASFNLGEMTVTRCTVQTAAGQVGHAYIAGRDLRRAELAAAIDALLQDPTLEPRLLDAVVTPLAEAQAASHAASAAKAAGTQVQFFSMQTMRS